MTKDEQLAQKTVGGCDGILRMQPSGRWAVCRPGQRPIEITSTTIALDYLGLNRLMGQDRACLRAAAAADEAAADYRRALIAQDKAEAEFQRAASAAMEANHLAQGRLAHRQKKIEYYADPHG